ncbi:MAG: HD domain-containing protein [Spirochaetales bacterium]|nr:HD domain-containing protein [Spirochaetales bacterium]
MTVKAPGPDEILPSATLDDPVLAAYYRVMRLKRLFRQGWLKRGIPEAACETVAEHSFGVAMLALLAPAPAPTPEPSPETAPGRASAVAFDRARALLLALVHELGETYAGDITPVDGVGPEEKSRLEREALLKALDGHPDRDAFLEAWEEFEAARTPEARFVKELDRLEMGLQAVLYRAEGSARMDEFFASARRAVGSVPLRALLERAIEADPDS